MKSSKPTDLELALAWRAGDLAAGDALLERHYDGIRRFFFNKMGSDCEDLIQSTFLGCVEAIERFRAESSFRTLLFAIAWRKLCRYLRDRPQTVEPLDPEDEPPAASAPTAGTRLDAQQEAERLRRAMRQLPPDMQAMLELYYWEAMSVEEIACVLEMPVNTVKTRMRRGRLRLEKELASPRRMKDPHG